MNSHPANFQPKRFFRELDRFLADSQTTGLGSDWFPRVVDGIVRQFGPSLMIDSGRVYEELDEGGFELVYQVGEQKPEAIGVVVREDYGPLQLVLEHGCFIFDPSTPGQSERLEQKLGGMESSALVVKSTPRRILAFGLRPGWERDDLDFTLNTLRNAINHRLGVQHLQTDYEQAAEIQRSLLPSRVPEFPGYTLAARSVTPEIVGGDFYDFVSEEPEVLAIAVGDASGHGLPAALLARDVVTGLRMGAERAMKITEVVNRLNRVIARSILSTRFVSLFFAELEDNGNLFYVNAGHPPGILVGPRGTRSLERGGTILGPLASSRFVRGWAHIDRGDTLAIVTDGVLERANRNGDLFGAEGVEAVLAKHRNAPAERVLDELFRAAAEFGHDRPWEDDTTALIIVRDP